MEKNNSLNNVFYSYPKSSNHHILLTKKDKVGVCDLTSNCTELNFSINKNKMIERKIFNDINNKIDNFTCVISLNFNIFQSLNLQNYNIVILFLVIILLVVLILHSKK